ncbi:MAG: molybdopterin-binding protein [Methylococcales bacterium]|nr:molybdopterin-binding protein [Methylococcales bacterium]
MNPTLEIFSQGEEIVTGQTVDTNAAWLSQQAVAYGFTVTRHTAVGDKLEDLIGLLQEISLRADCCICTGGLGPTSDDLTAVAVADAFKVPLVFDEIAFAQISRFFELRNRPMPASNHKQALLPQGALRLDNEWGTAPGFALQHGRCWFAFLPGVPMEMKHLFQECVLPTLTSRFVLQPGILVTVKTLGLGESVIQQRLKAIEIPTAVQLGFRATADDVQTKLLFPSAYPKAAMESLVAMLAAQLGDYVFAIDGLGEITGGLAFEVDKLMAQEGKTLALIETASHGLLAAKCVGLNWLLSAHYDQAVAQFGRHQPENGNELIQMAKTIAVELQSSSGADMVLVQLYTGEDTIMRDKDKSITVYNILLVGSEFHQASHDIAGPIQRKQNQAALLTLDLLRRYLQGGVEKF